MTRRSFQLPTAETDKVGTKITLTVEAYITKIEADLVDVGTIDDPEQALPAEQWTTFEISKVSRHSTSEIDPIDLSNEWRRIEVAP